MKDFEEKEELLEEEFESHGATRGINRIGRVLRIIFYIAVYAVMSLLVLRMCSDGTPASMETLTVNDRLASLYAEDKLEIFYQKFDEYTTKDENYGYFGIMQAIIIPETDEMQIVFRYNNSTLEKLPEDYPELCPEIPDRNGVYYDVTLVKVIDLTPDDPTDNNKEEYLKYERYYPTESATKRETTSLHNYFRYVFEGISTEDALEIYVDIYYKEDVNYDDDSYGSVRVYASENNTRIYPLSSKDKKALKNYAK